MNKLFDIECKTTWRHASNNTSPSFPSALQVVPKVGDFVLGYLDDPMVTKGSPRTALEFVVTRVTHTAQRIYITVDEPST